MGNCNKEIRVRSKHPLTDVIAKNYTIASSLNILEWLDQINIIILKHCFMGRKELHGL